MVLRTTTSWSKDIVVWNFVLKRLGSKFIGSLVNMVQICYHLNIPSYLISWIYQFYIHF